jgi:P2 family phage contractile tail tube protein
MALPNTLKGFSMFVDGFGFVGKLAGGQMPKLAIKTVEHRDGGMDTPVELDMGTEKLESSYTLEEYSPIIFQRFGLMDGSRPSVTLRGSMEDESGNKIAIVSNVQGMIKEIDPQEWKVGDKTQPKFMHAADYFKLTIGGEDMVEIDAINMVRAVGGVDQLAARRANLGL